MLVIDQLSYVSGMRTLNATLKFLFTVATIVICISTRSPIIGIVILLVTSFLSILYGKVPTRVYLKLMRLPLIFLLLSVIAIIITVAKEPLSFLAIPFFGNYLTIDPNQLIIAGKLITTAFACVSCLYFLALSTPMTNILTVLKKLKCPKIIIELMLLIYRFIFLLMSFSQQISDSQKSRLGNRSMKQSIKSLGLLGSVLLVKAFKRSSQIYDAMESRGYDGDINVLEEHFPIKIPQLFFAIGFDLLLILIYLLPTIF